MRDPTPEFIRQQKLLLSDLEIEFGRINRPSVSRDLRNSLYTRILVVKATVEQGETKLLRAAGRAARPRMPQVRHASHAEAACAGAD